MQELLLVFLTVEVTLLAIAGFLATLVYLSKKNSRLIGELSQQLSDLQQEDQDSFNIEKVETWFEKGELKKLNHYCEKFIAESPNSVHANWYFALSHFNQGDYDAAKNYFEKVISINPLWREGAVVYLQEITHKTTIKSPKTLH